MQLKKTIKRCGLVLVVSTVVIIVMTGHSYKDTIRVNVVRQLNERTVETAEKPINLTAANLTTTLPLPVNTLPVIGKEPKEPKKYNLLINAYMNSGSRFTGSLFGFRKDAFFFYEPLWKASVWEYYKTPNHACNSITDGCSDQTAAVVNRKIRALSTVPKNMSISGLLLGIMEKIYRCDFSHFDTLVVKEIAELATLSGPSWDPYRVCLKLRRPKGECIKKEEEICKKSKHKITKVLRMTVGSLEPLLRTFPDLKIVQLFRDPRAVINSRINSKGYPAKDYTKNSKAICRKMTWDLLEGKELLQKYPDRFKFVFYEDVKSDVLFKTEQLSNFIGMDYKSSEVTLLNKVKVNDIQAGRKLKVPGSRASDNAFWWRSNLPENILQIIQRECKTVLEYFGFRIFKSLAEVKDLNIPTFNVKDKTPV